MRLSDAIRRKHRYFYLIDWKQLSVLIRIVRRGRFEVAAISPVHIGSVVHLTGQIICKPLHCF